MNTLIEDAFEEGPTSEGFEHNYEPHVILYGAKGWTDEVDVATIKLLANCGAIRLVQTVSGVGWETRIYVSVEGTDPTQD